ncbi:hypothetical protein [Mannheimia varigena]|uniref:hypothetical protein n=1 Tax=Mannheimia varigena TaxID=85404 RepID=UPI0015B5819E|nr:hypothetical protein [Mannheimia varigena]MDY2947061.1 hypothetical protein [Mannheimia varigena]QLD33198.1 hypothetical protein A6B42_05195 [Mannheimia varigena]
MTEKIRKFAFSYSFNDRSWALTIGAQTKEEAIERVKAMSQAKYDGEIFATIPVPDKSLSFLARLIRSLLPKRK